MPSHSSSPKDLRIHLFGHAGADPAAVAHSLGAIANPPLEDERDLAIFAINPAHGIDQLTISQWEALSDSMVPRLIVVTGIEGNEADFDDAVMLANRVFDQCVTPYLVLHDDAGAPCALIGLQDLMITDYATQPPTISESSDEHKILVSEFQSEYLAAMEIAGDDGFAAGVLFPAIPIWLEKGIGLDIVNKYIDRLN